MGRRGSTRRVYLLEYKKILWVADQMMLVLKPFAVAEGAQILKGVPEHVLYLLGCKQPAGPVLPRPVSADCFSFILIYRCLY